MRGPRFVPAVVLGAVVGLLPGAAGATTPDPATAVIDAGATYTDDVVVTVTVTAKHCDTTDRWRMGELAVEARNGTTGTFAPVSLATAWTGSDGTTGCTAAAAKTSTFTWWLPGGDGTKTVEVRMAHGADAVVRSDTIVLDETAPVATITAPVHLSTAAGAAVEVVLTATDALSGVVSARVVAAGTTYAAAFVSGTTWRVPAVALACGRTTIQANATDAAGNVGRATAVRVWRTAGCPVDDGTGQAAPAIANRLLKQEPAVAAACRAELGRRWHGRVISAVAHHFRDGTTATEVAVRAYITGTVCA